MKSLVDTNVILDHLLQRAPFDADARKVLETLGKRRGSGFVAWHSLSNIHYITSLSAKKESVRPFLADLTTFLTVATVSHRDFQAALSYPMGDFEDAMQAAASKACGADYILTRNPKDFQHSPVPPILPEEWLRLFVG